MQREAHCTECGLLQRASAAIYTFLLYIYFTVCCAGSSPLHGLLPSCGRTGLLCSRGARLLTACWGCQELWLPGWRAQTHFLWYTALVALLPVGSSRMGHWPSVSCIGRWTRNRWGTREAPWMFYFGPMSPGGPMDNLFLHPLGHISPLKAMLWRQCGRTETGLCFRIRLTCPNELTYKTEPESQT